MLIAYPESNTRRSVYAVLLFLAVTGPTVLIVLAIKGGGPSWIAISSLLGGTSGTILLCIWCAVYVQKEPQRVRIALIWIAVLFLIMLAMAFAKVP
jgi:hypothetical protein